MASSVQRYLNSQPGSRDDQLSSRKLVRDAEDAGVAALGPLDDMLEEFYIRIPVRDGSGWQSTCKIIRPRETSKDIKKRPLIIMFHGGGWFRGSPEMFTRPGREFALAFDAVVVSVEYRLAPEYAWPTSVLDSWDVCARLTEAAVAGRPELFGTNVMIDDSGIILAGASAGANMACAVVSMSLLSTSPDQDLEPRWKRDPIRIPIKGVYLGVSFLLTKEIVPSEYKTSFTSRENNSSDSAVAQHAMDLYQPDVYSPMFSPVNLPTDKLSFWPRTYFQVGEQDIWRDDAVVVKAVLEKHGVEVKIDKYLTLAHVTWSVYTTGKGLDINSELGGKTMAAMAWLLKKSWP